METYRHVKAVKAKPGQPQNFLLYFHGAMAWFYLDILRIRRAKHRCCSRSLPAENLQSGMDGLTMPFCVNIAHAAADGYHTSMFINELQKQLDTITLKEL